MKLKLGEQSALVMCQYTSMAEVVRQAFGSEETGNGVKDPDRVDLAQAPTYDMALANINGALNYG